APGHRADARQALVDGRRRRQVHLLRGDRGAGKVEVGIGQGRDGDLARVELDPAGVWVGTGFEVDGRAGEGHLAVANPDRLDPTEAGVAGEGRDAAADERVERHGQAPTPTTAGAGGRGAASITGPQPGGSARSAARPSRSSPAPMPAARAMRALGPDRWPASSAPARAHVAPPPGKAYPVPAAPAAQRLVNATTIPRSIARDAASTSAPAVLPAPVASTTIPGGLNAAAASSSEPSIATWAVISGIPSTARSVVTLRRGPRARSRTTPASPTRPSGPVSRHWNVSRALAWVFVTPSAGLIVPSSTTWTPWPRSSGAAAQRTALRRFWGPSSFVSEAARIAPVTITGASASRTRSHRKAVSSITSVPW